MAAAMAQAMRLILWPIGASLFVLALWAGVFHILESSNETVIAKPLNLNGNMPY